MNLIAIIDFSILIIVSFSFVIFVLKGKTPFSLIEYLAICGLLGVLVFYYLSNFLEWSGISMILTGVEDYIALLAPLLYFFFLFNYIQKKTQKNLQENEKSLIEAFNRANFYRDLFTHDIRNILQNVLIATELIDKFSKDPDYLPKIKTNVESIKDQISRGENLVSNVFKLYEIDSLPIYTHKVDVVTILNDSIRDIKSKFKEKSLDIKIVAPDKNYVAKANDLLYDIFINLFHNAIIHNYQDLIEIVIELSKINLDDIAFIQIQVKDNGIGIIDNRKKLIFERAKMDGYYGIGLGLSLLKKIVDFYKGKIWVENRVSEDHTQGSNFLLLIPRTDQEREAL